MRARSLRREFHRKDPRTLEGAPGGSRLDSELLVSSTSSMTHLLEKLSDLSVFRRCSKSSHDSAGSLEFIMASLAFKCSDDASSCECNRRD